MNDEINDIINGNSRFATVTGTAYQVAPYLPHNYVVVGSDGERTVIAGVDRAGWTLDDYVLPRLASGLYFGREIDHPPSWLVAIARGAAAYNAGKVLVR